MTQPTSGRPLGITILAILAAIGGVVYLLAFLAAMGLGFGLVGIISLVLALAYLGFAYGGWTLQPWGWTLGVAIAAAGVLWALYLLIQPGGSIISLIISVAISGVILYYLYQPDVKAAFGRS